MFHVLLIILYQFLLANGGHLHLYNPSAHLHHHVLQLGLVAASIGGHTAHLILEMETIDRKVEEKAIIKIMSVFLFTSDSTSDDLLLTWPPFSWSPLGAMETSSSPDWEKYFARSINKFLWSKNI